MFKKLTVLTLKTGEDRHYNIVEYTIEKKGEIMGWIRIMNGPKEMTLTSPTEDLYKKERGERAKGI